MPRGCPPSGRGGGCRASSRAHATVVTLPGLLRSRRLAVDGVRAVCRFGRAGRGGGRGASGRCSAFGGRAGSAGRAGAGQRRGREGPRSPSTHRRGRGRDHRQPTVEGGAAITVNPPAGNRPGNSSGSRRSDCADRPTVAACWTARSPDGRSPAAATARDRPNRGRAPPPSAPARRPRRPAQPRPPPPPPRPCHTTGIARGRRDIIRDYHNRSRATRSPR